MEKCFRSSRAPQRCFSFQCKSISARLTAAQAPGCSAQAVFFSDLNGVEPWEFTICTAGRWRICTILVYGWFLRCILLQWALRGDRKRDVILETLPVYNSTMFWARKDLSQQRKKIKKHRRSTAQYFSKCHPNPCFLLCFFFFRAQCKDRYVNIKMLLYPSARTPKNRAVSEPWRFSSGKIKEEAVSRIC